MISAISNVSFRGETQPADFNALISSPGKYSQNAAPQSSAAKGDEVDLSTNEEKKSNKTAYYYFKRFGRSCFNLDRFRYCCWKK